MDLDGRDSFTILFVDEGEITINGAYRLGKGELLLLPAVMKQVTIEDVYKRQVNRCFRPECER